MLSKSKLLFRSSAMLRQASSGSKYIRGGNYAYSVDRASSALLNAFCTVAEPLKDDASLPTAEESPELPDWVTSSGEEKAEEARAKISKRDDFVPPSLSYWIEDRKIQVEDVDMKSVVDDIVKTDIDKVSEILKNQFESPDSVVKALDGCNVDVSEDLVEQVLKRFGFDWIPAFGFFKWAEMKKGTAHSSDLYNLMVDNLGKTKKFDMMWKLVGEMKKIEGYVTLDTLTKTVRRLAKALKFDDAVEAFGKKMEMFGVEKHINSMNMVVDALVKQGSVEHAERVYLDFKDQIPPNSHTYNVLVHGWCKTRKMEKAKSTIDEMREKGFSPDQITYTSLIESYCRERDFRKVDEMLDEMKKSGLNPSVVTYTVIMNALSKAKETEKALKIYSEMKKNDCAPDAAFYNVLIQALSNGGRLKDSDAVFEDMSKNGVSPNVATYNTLIHIAANALQEEKALKLLMKMETNRCKPDINTYAPLLKMCCILNRMKVLTFLLNHMFKNDLSVDSGTYSLLVARLSRNGRLARACSMFEEMVLKGFVPMECTYKYLVERLEKEGKDEEKKRVEQWMALARKN